MERGDVEGARSGMLPGLEPTTYAPKCKGTEPIFLVGAARSGTSLLYKAVCLHPDASYISNWVRSFPGRPQLAVLNRLARAAPTLRQQIWFADGNAYVYGRRRTLLERAFPMPVEGEPVFARAGIPEVPGPEVPPQARRALARSFEIMRRFDGGHHLVSKRIANNRRIPLLNEAFPGARFVHIIRDGRAVAASLSRVDWWPTSTIAWFGGTPADWEADGGDPWELSARNWVEELADIERGFAAATDPQVLHIRYEDFVAEPASTLRQVAAFGGLETDRQWEETIGRMPFPDRNDGWRVALPADAVRTIERVQQARLRQHGYLAGSA